MRHRLCLVLLLASALYQPVRSDFKKRKHPHLCASDDEKSEAANLKIKRFFFGYEGIYLVLKDKTIFFDLPIVDNYLNKSLLVFRDPIQFVFREEGDEGQEVIGYVQDHYMQMGSMKYYQIHLNQTDTGKVGEINEVLMNQENRTDGELGKIDLSTMYPHLKKLKQQIVDKNQFLVVQITKYNYFMLRYSPENGGTQKIYQFCRLINGEYSCLPPIVRNIEKKFKFFTYKLGVAEEGENSVLNLVQIDTDNRIYFTQTLLVLPGSVPGNESNNESGRMSDNEIRIANEYTIQGGFTFDELLSCHAKFEREREPKGIFNDGKLVDFYIIIRRFFIRVEYDLVQTGFKMNDSMYEKAQNLKTKLFGNKFELVESKWVKTRRLGAYLVTSQKYVFDLDAEAFAANDFKQQETPNLIDRCLYNTLVIAGKVFCFEEKHYWFFVSEVNLHDDTGQMYTPRKKLSKITDIFQNSPGIGYNAGQELKFIFNYLNDSFVFMTYDSLFVFSYDRFSVNEHHEIIANYSSNERVLVVQNHFFDDLAKQGSRLGNYVKLVILLLIIILILLIVYDVCISGNLTCGELLQKCCMQKADSPPPAAADVNEAKLRGAYHSPKTAKEMNSLVSGASLKQTASSESNRSGRSIQKTSSIRFVDPKRSLILK